MANTYRHTGRHIPITSASGAISSGALVVQEGWFGIAITSAASGGSLQIDTAGVHNVPVPSGTVKGDLLYSTAVIGTESVAVTLTKTTTPGFIFGKAVGDRDTAGNGLVLLATQP